MGSKNKKTWDAIFTDPVKADIEWHDIESLFVTAGAEITEGNESRVRVKLKGIRAFDMFFLTCRIPNATFFLAVIHGNNE